MFGEENKNAIPFVYKLHIVSKKQKCFKKNELIYLCWLVVGGMGNSAISALTSSFVSKGVF